MAVIEPLAVKEIVGQIEAAAVIKFAIVVVK